MSPVTHFLSGWVLANAAALNRRERAAVTIAAVVPDLDGVGIFAEVLTRNSAHRLLWFSEYHHILHNLLFGLIVAGVVFAVARRRWVTALLALAAFHIHLVEDLVGSRGPDGFDWPIPYLLPFTGRWAWTWQGQWALNAWPNLLLTVTLLALTLWLARFRGFSPIELSSQRADRAVVSALQAHF
jgi:inner membrane protein